MVQTKQTVTEMMKSNIVKVVFETKSGNEAVKYATLIESILPPRPIVEDANDTMKTPRKQNEKQVSFWSVEDSAWRSFIIDNLKSVEVLSEGEAEFLLKGKTKNAVSS